MRVPGHDEKTQEAPVSKTVRRKAVAVAVLTAAIALAMILTGAP
ncbi:MAG TPA: hypothetical protein VHJ17_12225 [Thermomonospora sp.]|nr:hypothetical protein [Thermomonospora sp.]